MHAQYAPGNQQCRRTLQLRTSCAGVQRGKSPPTYFKLLYLLNHSSNLIHSYTILKIIACTIKWLCLCSHQDWFCSNSVDGKCMFCVLTLVLQSLMIKSTHKILSSELFSTVAVSSKWIRRLLIHNHAGNLRCSVTRSYT